MFFEAATFFQTLMAFLVHNILKRGVQSCHWLQPQLFQLFSLFHSHLIHLKAVATDVTQNVAKSM